MTKHPTRSLGEIEAAKLEDWLRDRYFQARVDISSSGMANYSVGTLRRLLQIPDEELDSIAFRDSPSLGSDALREAIASRYAQGQAERVMVGHGSTEAIFLAIAAFVRPGDEIITVHPAYQALTATAASLGAILVPWRLHADNGFRPDIDELRTLIGARTKLVVVNFPHNPTGTTISAADFADLLKLIDATGCHLLWDGAFSDIQYVTDHPPIALPEHPAVISFGTLSKAYGLPGMRLGWSIGAPELLNQMVRIRDYTTLNTSPLNEHLAQRVITQADKVLAPLLRTARRNREIVADWATRLPSLISLPLPDGGVCAFPQVKGVTSLTAACEDLLRERGVLVVPGECFGHPDRLRLGFGGDSAELRDGLRHLAEVMATSCNRRHVAP